MLLLRDNSNAEFNSVCIYHLSYLPPTPQSWIPLPPHSKFAPKLGQVPNHMLIYANPL